MNDIPIKRTGKFVTNARGFGFINDLETKESFFVFIANFNNALFGDIVEYETFKAPKRDKEEARVISIIERQSDEIIVRIVEREGYLNLDPINYNFWYKIRCPYKQKLKNNIKDGDIYKVRIKEVDSKKRPSIVKVNIIKFIADKDNPKSDIITIIESNGAYTKFPNEVLNEANKVSESISNEELKRRTDLRNLFTFTIDNDDSKDLDDAISIRREEDNFRLWVHIADVSHYVQEGTKIDKEALKRGTSIYVADMVEPMLPKNISNNICSLNEGVDRLTLTCEMLINRDGEVIEHNIVESVINSNKRLTYTYCNEIIDNKDSYPEKDNDIYRSLIILDELKEILHASRYKMGTLDFNIKEPKLVVEDNKVIDIIVKEPGVSNKIIEEMMLIANVTVARHMFFNKLPAIYRVHEVPKLEKLVRLSDFVQGSGNKFSYNDFTKINFEIQNLIRAVKGTPQEMPVTIVMLRSLEKARYSAYDTSHFALGFKYYTHFTSPIRRYPDLLLHRIIRLLVFDKFDNQEVISALPDMIEKIADQNSDSERIAITCEREVMAIKKAEFMSDKLDTEFEGTIISVMQFGFFVELENTIEGLVSFKKSDKNYIYDEKAMTLVNDDNKEEYYFIGKKVNVKLTNVVVEKREIDFELV